MSPDSIYHPVLSDVSFLRLRDRRRRLKFRLVRENTKTEKQTCLDTCGLGKIHCTPLLTAYHSNI